MNEEGGMEIQAHPFREAWYIQQVQLYPEDVDGVEGINATHSNAKSTAHNNVLYDQRAIAYGKEHHFPMTAGSDIHSTSLLGGGVAFARRLKSGKDYCNAILNGEDYILTNGEKWYDKNGEEWKEG